MEAGFGSRELGVRIQGEGSRKFEIRDLKLKTLLNPGFPPARSLRISPTAAS